MTSTLNNLLEIRQRILKVLIFFCTMFLLLFFYADKLFLLLIQPLQQMILPGSGSKLIATQMTSTVWIPIGIAADAALLCTIPFGLIQIWLFIAPGLFQQEKKIFIRIAISCLGLFLLGLLFCFMVVLPLIFQFFAQSTPTAVTLMPDISSSTHFITHMLWIFGLAFEVPLICIILVQQAWITRTQLKQCRPYVIVSAFIIGMLLTPPDVLSQVMLAVPLCLLYELGILFSSSPAGHAPTKRSVSKPTSLSHE